MIPKIYHTIPGHICYRKSLTRPRRSCGSSWSRWFRSQAKSGLWCGRSPMSTQKVMSCRSLLLNRSRLSTSLQTCWEQFALALRRIIDPPLGRLRSKRQLEDELQKLDGQYDVCNNVMAKGEVNGFGPEWRTEKNIVNIYIIIYILYQQITFSCTCMGFNVCTYHKNGVLDSTHLWNHADEVRDPSHDCHEQCDIHVWASWQFVPLFMRIHIYTIYTLIASSCQPDMISFRLKIVDTCPQWPRCSTACAAEAKTRSLPQRNQRHAQCPTYILAIFFQECENGMRRRTLICPDPHLWKRRRKIRQTNVTRNLWRPKKRKGETGWGAQSAEVPKVEEVQEKTSDVFDSSWSFFDLWDGLPIYRAIIFCLGTPNKFVSPEGTCRSTCDRHETG